jgi:transposase
LTYWLIKEKIMSSAKDLSIRCKVIEEWRTGSSYKDLSMRHGLHYHTVRTWCLRWLKDQESGLVARYSNCGKGVSLELDKAFRLVRFVAHKHPNWGIPYILCRIRRAYPELALKSARQYQRHIKRHKDKVVALTLPKSEPIDQARVPHEVWQIDAKERILLKDQGAEVCYLNFTDEKTSAVLKAYAFSPR